MTTDAAYPPISCIDQGVEAFVNEARNVIRPPLLKHGWSITYDGADGFGCIDHRSRGLRVIHSVSRELDGEVWAHVSMSRRDGKLPSWGQLRDAWRMIYPDLAAYVVIPAEVEHVDIAEVAHAWGCLTKKDILPDFTRGGNSI